MKEMITTGKVYAQKGRVNTKVGWRYVAVTDVDEKNNKIFFTNALQTDQENKSCPINSFIKIYDVS
jgi:hypothetical protein